jgi:hypothetical protein
MDKKYIKKHWKDFYGQPDIFIPKRTYLLKLGIPRCQLNNQNLHLSIGA